MDDIYNNGHSFPDQNDNSIEKEELLPIYEMKCKLMDAYEKNRILIIAGETGCGKTTKLPQFISELVHCKQINPSLIGCTQPRCVAAVAVATRVAEELGVSLGSEVGYAIRFDNCTSNKTKIKYMTDGILLREVRRNPSMTAYHTIIIDEAHERTLATDILLGLVRRAISIRPDLKVIITSASMDTAKFSEFFSNAPVISIPGRCFPIDILHTTRPADLENFAKRCVETVLQIHYFEEPGDILVFLTGQAEIEWACETLLRHPITKSGVDNLQVLPVYSLLPVDLLARIFEPAPKGSRKVVIATNIAETSLTIDGIRYVVDSGFFKQKGYEVIDSIPSVGVNTLDVIQISRAQALQRCGRSGRTSPGKCYRLYSEETYRNTMKDIQTPEIQRTNLNSMVLQLKAMGVSDVLGFSFIDRPSLDNLVMAVKSLNCLNVLDDEGHLLPIGYDMAAFPIEPCLARLLIKSVGEKCSEEMLTIVAMLSVQNIFFEPKDEQSDLALSKKVKFFRPEGDLMTLLNVYYQWKQNSFSDTWCQDNFIQLRAIKRALYIRRQLYNAMNRLSLDSISLMSDEQFNTVAIENIQKVIGSTFYYNVARKIPDEKNKYRAFNSSMIVSLLPGSSLIKVEPEWVVYNELVETTKIYIKDVTPIKYEWLLHWINGNDLFFFEQLNKKTTKSTKSKMKKSNNEVNMYIE